MGMLDVLSTHRACVCAPPLMLTKTLPFIRLCAPANDPNASVNPVTSALMCLVVFIDLLAWVVERVGAAPTFSRMRSDGNTDEVQLFQWRRRSLRLQYPPTRAPISAHSPVLGAVE